MGESRDTNEQGWSDIGVVIQPIYEYLTNNGDEFGTTIIPIGILFAGDLLCLDFRKDSNNPNVCVWHHGDFDEFEPVTTKVADNFEQFISMLR